MFKDYAGKDVQWLGGERCLNIKKPFLYEICILSFLIANNIASLINYVLKYIVLKEWMVLKSLFIL